MPSCALLVEDSPTQAEALRLVLIEQGYAVAVVHSGEEALDYLRSSSDVEVVLSDIVMPGMSGFDLTRQIKAEFGSDAPPVILLTTLSDPTDIVRGLEAGADNYLTKPYEPRHLVQRVGQVLESRKLRGAQRVAAGPPVSVSFLGNTFSISAEREQILDMLLSSFEELIRTTTALRQSKSELQISHARAEDRAERLTRLQQITESLSRSRTGAEVADVVLTAARDWLHADAGIAVTIDEPAESLEVLGAIGQTDATGTMPLPLHGSDPLSLAARSGELIVIDAAHAASESPQRSSVPGGRAALIAGLTADARTFGAWGIYFDRNRSFGAMDQQFFLTLTRQFAQALDRARLYEAEQRARAEAEEANRAKAQFLAAMSHDLRTPLNAIAGYVDIIDLGIRGPVTDRQRQDLGRIKRSQEFLLALINDVLNFAKLEAGSVQFDISAIKLAPLLQDLETMLRPQMESKSLSYSWSVSDPQLYVAGDREKLQQVLLNLGGNALKFTPSGGTVSVTGETSGESALIRVKDSGIGIPKENLATIFDPFVQVNPEAGGTREGIGLGLSISHALMDGMGGMLSVESQVGAGSTFTVTIPLAMAPTAASSRAARA
jgi:signal transduction histidine kinase/DNA-binding response OmpR family regulator